MAPKIIKGQRIPSVDYDGETISVDDCVLINPDQSQASQPFVAKIHEIIQPDSGDDIQLRVQWFYRPEEAYGGRKVFHGEKELFMSDHYDNCSLKTIISKCRVLSLPKYQELKKIEDTDFYARFTYKAKEQLFEPPKVPVFCRCEMPYNPDQFMVCCDACSEWYHPKCLKLTKQAVQHVDKWRCPDCERYAAMTVVRPAQLDTPMQHDAPATKRAKITAAD